MMEVTAIAMTPRPVADRWADPSVDLERMIGLIEMRV